MKEALLNEYARLVVRVGVNVQPAQPVVINAPIEGADFARRLAGAAYEAGARDVTVNWSDETLARLRLEHVSEDVLGEYPHWKKALYEDNAAAGAAFISLQGDDPEIFRGIAPVRLQKVQRAAGEALMDYRARMMSNKNTWCVAAIPTRGWARKVFPDKTPADAVAALWTAILETVRVMGDGGAADRWRNHIAFLRRAADFLNRNEFDALHYRNARGTDLTVGLPLGHLWVGGEEATEAADGKPGGVPFVANLPTEEVYTLPDRDRTEGVVYGTKPLVFHGNLIDGLRLTFRAGKVVDFDADKGRELLGDLLGTDEGAAHLGEVALVPFDSPISQSGLLFYNTLFDENAACHLALGKAYPTCLKGGADMDSVTLLGHGVNDSLLHEDFMIGSRDLSIAGRKKDGQEVPVFREGNFVEF